MKSLVAAGSVAVPTSFVGVPVVEGQQPSSIRDLIPTAALTGTDRYGYLRQSVRTNNAATVSAGSVKPTSVYTVQRIEDRARTIAHLSEPINKNDLADATALQSFVDSELRYGLSMECESQILTGDGDTSAGLDNMEGILEVEGTTPVPFDLDLVATTRHAVTLQQLLGNVPSAWAFHPSDWELFELLTDDVGRPLTNVNSPVNVAQKLLWGLPVVVSAHLPLGSAILGDWSGSALLYVRQQATVDWSENVFRPDAISPGVGASDFSRNLISFRAEERVGLAILRPSAFSVVDVVMPAPSGG